MLALLAAMIGRWDGVPAAEMDWAAYPQFNIEPGTVHHLLLTKENLSHGTRNPEITEEFSHDSPDICEEKKKTVRLSPYVGQKWITGCHLGTCSQAWSGS
jgi:hypothetical protein